MEENWIVLHCRESFLSLTDKELERLQESMYAMFGKEPIDGFRENFEQDQIELCTTFPNMTPSDYVAELLLQK